MAFLLISVAFDTAQVLGLILIIFYYLSAIDPSGWMTSLITALVLLRGLDLRLISRRGIVGLSHVFVLVGSFIAGLPIGILFISLGQQAMIFWVPGIDFPNVERWF